MSLKLNGSTGFLEYAGRLVNSFPCSLMVWVSSDAGGTGQMWIAQQQSNANRAVAGWLDGNGTSKYAYVQNPGGGGSAALTAAPHPNSTMRLAVAVFHSPTSATMYYGSAVGQTSSMAATDDLSNHNRFTVGAWHLNSAAAALFTNGSVAEPHVFSVDLTDDDVADLLADDVKPEELAGWVDGWTLKDHAADGNYVSITGTRTLVAAGGVTASAQPHPISRTAPSALTGTVAAAADVASGAMAIAASSMTGTVAAADDVASGAMSLAGVSALTGTVAMDDALASGAMSSVAPATIVSGQFKSTETKLPIGAATLAHAVVLRVSDRHPAASVAAPTTDIDSRMTITGAGLTAGVAYLLVAWNVDGTLAGVERLVAA